MAYERTAEPPADAGSISEPLRHPAPSAEQIRAQLARIVSNASFASSERPRRFLSYIIEQTLRGEAKRLKQYSIATEVLGRPHSFDPEIDPVVRLEAGKLRRAVENYYLRDGAHDPVLISIPKGSYVPVFDWPAKLGSSEAAISLPSQEAAGRDNVAWLSVPNIHRVAILPFHLPATDAECVLLGQGLHDQLVVELARYNEISVVAASRLHEQADPVLGILDLAKDARARFILSGSIRQYGAQIRITVQLYDATTSSILWTESFDGNVSTETTIALQDRISRHIAGAIADYYGVISRQISLEAVYATDQAWTVNVAIQRHRYLARTLAESAYHPARRDLDRAIRVAPHHPMVWAALAHTIFYGNVLGFQSDDEWLALVERCAQRAFELDHRCAFGHVVMAMHRLYRGELDEVLDTCQHILRDNPHAPSARLSAGFFSALAGNWSTGTAMINEAVGMLLHPPSWPYRATFLGHYHQGDYVAALRELNNYNSPESFTPPLLRAAGLAQLGRIDEAKIAAREVMRLCPRFAEVSTSYFRYLVAIPSLSDRLQEGARKAGLPI